MKKVYSFILIIILGCSEKENEVEFQSPGVRNAHAMVYNSLSREVILFGGATDSLVTNDLWFYKEEQWYQKKIEGEIPIPRTFAAMEYNPDENYTLLHSGNKVLFGKETDKSNVLSDTWVLKGNEWSLINTPHAPPSRAESSIVYDKKRKVMVLFGGYKITADGSYIKLNDTWEFNGEDWIRKITSSSPSPRHGTGLVYDERLGKIILFGGSTYPKSYGEKTGETWTYDGKEWKIINRDDQPENIFNSAMASNSDYILRFGGWNGSKRINETYIFRNNSWEKLNLRIKPSQRNHSKLIYNGESFILYGGHDGENIFGDLWEFSENEWKMVNKVEPQKRIKNNH